MIDLAPIKARIHRLKEQPHEWAMLSDGEKLASDAEALIAEVEDLQLQVLAGLTLRGMPLDPGMTYAVKVLRGVESLDI